MTCKLLLALAMSVIVLVGCEGSKDADTHADTPESKRLMRIFESHPASVTAHQVQDLLDRGASANATSRTKVLDSGRTPLMYAAETNENPEVISVILVLLKAGADVNAVSAASDGNLTPLMYAARRSNNPEVISVLLEAGADVNATGVNWTVLMYAVCGVQQVGHKGNPEVTSVLLKAGADVNAKSKAGKTPLMIAARWSNNPEVISLLLEAGADVNVIDQDGRIALDYAQSRSVLKGTQALKELEEATNP